MNSLNLLLHISRLLSLSLALLAWRTKSRSTVQFDALPSLFFFLLTEHSSRGLSDWISSCSSSARPIGPCAQPLEVCSNIGAAKICRGKARGGFGLLFFPPWVEQFDT